MHLKYFYFLLRALSNANLIRFHPLFVYNFQDLYSTVPSSKILPDSSCYLLRNETINFIYLPSSTSLHSFTPYLKNNFEYFSSQTKFQIKFLFIYNNRTQKINYKIPKPLLFTIFQFLFLSYYHTNPEIIPKKKSSKNKQKAI